MYIIVIVNYLFNCIFIFLSIIGSCLAGLFGRYLGSWGSAFITTSCLFLSFIISFFAFYEVAL
jgi:NADH-ubiquinone oxidoreductase chain 5